MSNITTDLLEKHLESLEQFNENILQSITSSLLVVDN